MTLQTTELSLSKDATKRKVEKLLKQLPEVEGSALASAMPIMPRLGVAALIYPQRGIYVPDEPMILLGKRAKTPNKGKWVFPGGGVKFRETCRQALVREIKEETNLELDLRDGLKNPYVLQIIEKNEHRVILCYEVFVENEIKSKAGSDLSELKWFTQDDIISEKELSDAILPALIKFGWL